MNPSSEGSDPPQSQRSTAGSSVRKRGKSELSNNDSANSAGAHKFDGITHEARFNARDQVVTIRPPNARKAMGRMARQRTAANGPVRRKLWTALHFCSGCFLGKDDYHDHHDEEDGGESDEEDESIDAKPQYTLKAIQRAPKSKFPLQSLRQKLCFCCSRSTMTSEAIHPYFCFIDVNVVISKYLSWSFRTSYFLLLNMFALLYFGQILVFALIFYCISTVYPMCINSAGNMIGTGEGARMFGDTFQLSWTTFSTVGYGVIFPSTGASGYDVGTGCVVVGILGSFEAFLGVLYAGFCGAILFGKVLRSQNNAQVFFSDPIVVRYGKEELCDNGTVDHSPELTIKEHDEEMGESSTEADKHIPCPSLEFRLVNRLHGVPSGEIVEAKLDCVAILDPKLAKLNKTTKSNVEASSGQENQLKIDEGTTIAELAKALNSRAATRTLAFHSTGSKQPHMFTKISLDADEHPFFRRVWFGRHRLDENSPLLTPAARRRVKLCGGYWPKEWNNFKSIKKCIQFRHILVCVSGTANANAASVYAQKVYDLVDVNVGYKFVPMNYHTDEGELQTDPYLLNAVYPQRGGGAEPF